MSIVYNFQEVYEIALQIEENGLAFYRKFSEVVKEQGTRELLAGLAEWEVKHSSLFRGLRDEEADNKPYIEVVEKNSDTAAYLRSIADSHVFLKGFDLEDLSKTLLTTKQILEKALRFEQDTVNLYENLLPVIPDALGKESVKKLATEERLHVEIISKELELYR